MAPEDENHLRVSLYAEQGEDSRYIDAKIDGEGNLVISGHDLGEICRKYWGDSDYEYWLTVSSENKHRVLKALMERCSQAGLTLLPASRSEDEALLHFIKQFYGGRSSALSDFWDLTKAQGIPAEFFSYA